MRSWNGHFHIAWRMTAYILSMLIYNSGSFLQREVSEITAISRIFSAHLLGCSFGIIKDSVSGNCTCETLREMRRCESRTFKITTTWRNCPSLQFRIINNSLLPPLRAAITTSRSSIISGQAGNLSSGLTHSSFLSHLKNDRSHPQIPR